MIGQTPDEMPRELHESEANDLMNTIQGFCNESTLPRVSIIGALEGVKFALLRNWFREDEEQRE